MKRLSFSIILILLIIAVSDMPQARVTGRCDNCHTMHNSQGGTPMAVGELPPGDGPPHQNLLINSCIGCHTGTNTGTNTTPYVYSITPPTYGSNTLAGGNFYWVKTDDTKGHNVFPTNPEDTLDPVKAPGDLGFSTCGTNGCHANIHGTVSDGSGGGLDGKQGCTKCHMVETAGPKGFHHANDGTGTKYVETEAKGWYRFLEGHMSGSGCGVAGIEHEKWNYGATESSHNEYSGVVWDSGYGFGAMGNTMTAFCTGCHGDFHSDQGGTSSPFLRHPSDIVIKNSGEYASAFGAVSGSGIYDPELPVARPSGFNWAGGPSNTVSLGTDMVMCLSCHVAHGSPYYKMLRWDNKANMTGCVVCHTSKS